MGRLTVRVACGASLIIGLLFVFVWAPHPWGWAGFDQYYDLGQLLARGKPFPTTDVPWGYAYFLAFFYRLFGDRPWIPLIVQTALNASLPLLTYQLARQLFDARVASVAALLTGFLSFNTVYASTQSSDAVCNVLFMAGVLMFVRALQTDSRGSSAFASGVIFGIASQFRPNLILVPLLLALFIVIVQRVQPRAVAQAALLLGASALMIAPWVIRNYRLTEEILPTSTHGGVQLWYGTLQTGPYLHSRAHNPRSVFERSSFPYTCLDRVPLVITGRRLRCPQSPENTHIVYWTDRNPEKRTVNVQSLPDGSFQAMLPASGAPTTFYYFVSEVESSDQPHVFFVSGDHLGDLDVHGDLLDVFDIVRLVRHAAWNEPIAQAQQLDFDGDGEVSKADAAAAAQILLAHADPPRTLSSAPTFHATSVSAGLVFPDGSSIEIPKAWHSRITDTAITGDAAEAILHTTIPLSWLEKRPRDRSPCDRIASIDVNDVFYREQPHSMRRYTALALDNIQRDPPAYLASVLYRAARVFFIEGTDDPHTTHQFSGGSRVYQAAFAVSIGLLALAVVGVYLAWRRGAALGVPLLLIGYIPATLAFVLTNMRYSITVQPLVFMFVATTLVTTAEVAGWVTPRRAKTETAHPL